jgi:selenium metabolism protein YedF
VVFVATDRLGTGVRKLGEILMKGFLNTLWDAEAKPTKILFLNDAVRLTTEGSEVLDSLKLIEEAGVEMFSCGNCLEYYGLKDKLRVRSITTMYDNVESLLPAAKVVKMSSGDQIERWYGQPEDC